MAKKPPIGPLEKRPPYTPVLRDTEMMPNGRLSYDQNHQMWIKTDVRRRSYICRFGDEHTSYYRTHWRQGREDWVACDDEVAIYGR